MHALSAVKEDTAEAMNREKGGEAEHGAASPNSNSTNYFQIHIETSRTPKIKVVQKINSTSLLFGPTSNSKYF
jgi:hypothetical protein